MPPRMNSVLRKQAKGPFNCTRLLTHKSGLAWGQYLCTHKALQVVFKGLLNGGVSSCGNWTEESVETCLLFPNEISSNQEDG